MTIVKTIGALGSDPRGFFFKSAGSERTQLAGIKRAVLFYFGEEKIEIIKEAFNPIKSNAIYYEKAFYFKENSHPEKI